MLKDHKKQNDQNVGEMPEDDNSESILSTEEVLAAGEEPAVLNRFPADDFFQQQVAELQLRLQQAQAEVLLARADADNARKRAQMEIDKSKRYAHERFAKDLLCVLDSLNMALSAEGQTFESLIIGVQMSVKQMLGVLDRWQIQPINALGKTFDPHLHQAMTMVESSEPVNTVVQVLQSGYVISDRVLRPACVTVSKAMLVSAGDVEEHPVDQQEE